jgi:Txe/YoeB family toxin of Txe-Axe toxin-antitoxin module
MLNGWALPILQNPVIAILLTIIIFGGVFTLIYGLVFNRTTRQGIHDLLVGSYVINAPPNLEAITPQIPRIHQRITYGLLGVGLIISIAGLLVQQSQSTLGILETGELGEIQELQSSLLDNDDFFSVGVTRVNRNRVGSPEVLKDLNIEVWTKTSCKRNPSYCNELVNQIARTAFEKYGNIENLSGMRIAVVNRFDFGLASGNLTQGVAWSIEDWQKELEN